MRPRLGYNGPTPFPKWGPREAPQICARCSAETGIPQVDSLYDDAECGPLCEECYEQAMGLWEPEDTEELNFDRD